MTLETFLDDLADYMEANEIAPVHIAGNYEIYGNGIFIAPYGGLFPMHVVSAEGANPIGTDLQILISNTSNETALALVFKTIRLLKDVHNKIIGETKFLYIQQKYGAFFTGKSNAEYYNYSLNFSVLIA